MTGDILHGRVTAIVALLVIAPVGLTSSRPSLRRSEHLRLGSERPAVSSGALRQVFAGYLSRQLAIRLATRLAPPSLKWQSSYR